jgi:hypothetical protein
MVSRLLADALYSSLIKPFDPKSTSGNAVPIASIWLEHLFDRELFISGKPLLPNSLWLDFRLTAILALTGIPTYGKNLLQ